MEFHEFWSPFAATDLDQCDNDPLENVQCSTSVSVQKTIPSLVQLCLRANRRCQSKLANLLSCNQYLLQKLSDGERDSQSINALHLSWLHRFLYFCESRWKPILNYDEKKKCCKITRYVRSCFTLDCRYDGVGNLRQDTEREVMATIPHMSNSSSNISIILSG